MKKVQYLIIIVFIGYCCKNESQKETLSKSQTVPLILAPLGLGYDDVSNCNCLFAKDWNYYWNKELAFARRKNGLGIIQFGDNKLRLKITKPLSNNRIKGQSWQETYANDTIEVQIFADSVKNKISSRFTYDATIYTHYQGKSYREKLIGECSF